MSSVIEVDAPQYEINVSGDGNEVTIDEFNTTIEVTPGAIFVGGNGGSTWGSITGSISDQSDLQAELNSKLSVSAFNLSTFTTSDLDEGGNLYFTDARAIAAVDLSGYALLSGAAFTGSITAQNLSGTNTGDQDLSSFITASSTDTLTNKSGSNSQWTNDENYVVESNLLTSSLSSGMISGGGLSVNAGDNTKFDISAGVGIIIDNWTDPDNPVIYNVPVDMTGVSVTNITTQNQTHVLLMPDGSIDQREDPPSASDRRLCIYLGQIGHGGRTTIQGVLPRPDVFASPVSQLRDLMYALGAINLGVSISAGGSDLTISRNAGQIFLDGANAINNPIDPHLVTLATENPKLVVMRTQTGAGANSNDLDVGNYDVGGVITPIAGNKYQNIRAYQFGNGNVLFQYGQEVYNSLSNATEAIQTESFIANPATQVAAVLVSIISVRSTATDLSDPAQATFSSVSMFGETVSGIGGGASIWGGITGTLSDQTDLQAALDNKADTTSVFSGDYNDLTNQPALFSGAYADLTGTPTIPTNNNELANGAGYINTYSVTQADVTQYEGNLTITEAQISDLGTYQPLATVLTNTTASFTTGEEAKLAGIEAGATTDQTGTEIVTAIDTELGSADWQGGSSETFETISHNLRSWDYALTFLGGEIQSIDYSQGAETITKTMNYTTGTLTSIVLSGDTPAGIELTKTLSYTGSDLTGVAYS